MSEGPSGPERVRSSHSPFVLSIQTSISSSWNGWPPTEATAPSFGAASSFGSCDQASSPLAGFGAQTSGGLQTSEASKLLEALVVAFAVALWVTVGAAVPSVLDGVSWQAAK